MPAKGRKTNSVAGRAQKPASRARVGRGPVRSGSKSWQNWRAYLPTILMGGLCLTVLVVLGVLYYAATSSAFFQLRDVSISGNTRTTTDEIRAVVQRQTAGTGVWRVNLVNLSAEINRLPWVQQAVVARILPDGVRVQIKERSKSAVILSGNGKLLWVDDEGVRLGPYTAADKVPNLLVLKGWNEADNAAAQAENAQRMKVYKEVLAQWEVIGVTKYVSDMDLSSVRDVRASLRSRPEVPILLGDRNWGSRLADAMQALKNRNDVESLDTKMDNGDVIVAERNNGTAKPGTTPVTAGNRTRPATTAGRR